MASGKKRRWGTVIARHDEEGNVTAYVARYVDPTDHTHRISKQFRPEYLTQAYQWLDEESYLVVLHNKGISEWTPPSMRKEQHHGTGMLFEEWVEEYFREYVKTHTLRGRTKRRTSLAKRRVLRYFTGRKLTAITENDIQRWVGRLERDIDTPNGRETTMRMMKRLMKAACDRGLIEKNPCTYVIREGKPTKRDVEPLTSTEVAVLANAMPEYTRLAVWLSLLVGGYYQRIVPEHRKDVAERVAEEYIGMMMSDEDSIEREIRNLDDEIERMREERRKLTMLLNGRQTTTDTCGPSDH